MIHWLFALTVFGLFGLGLYMVELSYYDSWYRGSLDLHKSIGMTLLLLFLGRCVWRLLNVQPKPEPAKNWELLGAKIAHVMLYVLPLLLMVSGYLISTADGREVMVFELIPVPAVPALIDNQEDVAGEIHEFLAWAVILLAAFHGLAALKHHFVNKDNTLKRMLGL